jgi:hypothetical protein
MRSNKLGLLCVMSVVAACGGDSDGPEQDASFIYPTDASLSDAGGSFGDGGSWAFDASGFDASAFGDASVLGDGGAFDASAGDGGALNDAAQDAQVDASGDAGPPPEGSPWLNTAPRATCVGSAKPDGTLGGLNGDFRCNLEVIGQVAAPHFLSLAWYNDCAYVNGTDGTTVIHVDAAGKPTITTTLTTTGFKSNWETMKANPVSGLLAGYESNGAMLTVYDVSADCKAPVLQSSTRLGGLVGSLGHAGSFSPDGTIYYASSMFSATIYAMDLAMPKAPAVITSDFAGLSAHDLFIGKQGKRGYFAYPVLTKMGTGSFAIMDLTQVQARAADAKGTVIKQVEWEDGSTSQYPIAFSSEGRDLLMITDELGSGNCDNPLKPQWGYARIFDISNEQSPKLLSLIKTEAQDPKNCKAAETANGGVSGFGLGTHYCNVDRLENPRVLMCGNWDAGLRVYDIRNPSRPKEVAYFDTPTANMPGLARLMPEKREIWIAVTPGTFYVLKIIAGSALDQLLAN